MIRGPGVVTRCLDNGVWQNPLPTFKDLNVVFNLFIKSILHKQINKLFILLTNYEKNEREKRSENIFRYNNSLGTLTTWESVNKQHVILKYLGSNHRPIKFFVLGLKACGLQTSSSSTRPATPNVPATSGVTERALWRKMTNLCIINTTCLGITADLIEWLTA